MNLIDLNVGIGICGAVWDMLIVDLLALILSVSLEMSMIVSAAI